MIKDDEFKIAFMQRLADAIAISLSWLAAYFIRFETIIPNAQQGLEFIFAKQLPILIFLYLYFAHKNGLYHSLKFFSRLSEISAVTKSNALAFAAFIIFVYFLSEEKLSRIALFNYFVLSQVFLVFTRVLGRKILKTLRLKGHYLKNILVVGNSKPMKQYISAIGKHRNSGLRIIGWVDSDNEATRYNIKDLGSDLDIAKQKVNPDIIVVGYEGENGSKIKEILKKHYNDVVSIQLLPDLSYSIIGHSITHYAGIPILSINQPRINFFNKLYKRLFDFFSSLIGLLLLSPLFLLIAFAIKLTSKGPIFYGQKRMGLDGKTFTMWKFRSMKVGAENSTGAVWTTENDPRRTSIGTMLRTTSLDELPQLWNVLTGDMSLVGPRPERPIFVDKFKNQIPAYMLRHKMKAGLTGWAQVNGWRGNTDLAPRIECDIYYIKNWSLWFDIKIILLTIWKGLIHKNAY